MSCLTASQRAAIKVEIAEIDAFLILVNAAYSKSLTNGDIEEYRFDSGDGSQRTTRRNPKDLKEQRDELKSERQRLVRKLLGTANVNMNLRRRRGYSGGFGRSY